MTFNPLDLKYGKRIPSDREEGYLEPIEKAVLWSFSYFNNSIAVGKFATTDTIVGSNLTSDELVKLHMAQQIPTWVTHFYWC